MDENDWLVTLVFLSEDDKEERAAGAETIGYFEGFAFKTNTRILALRGGPSPADPIELLFSFDTPEHKAEFRKLAASNEFTAPAEEELSVPDEGEIRRAQPLGSVLPPDVATHAGLVAMTLTGCADPGGES
jgi:hypothetical protein